MLISALFLQLLDLVKDHIVEHLDIGTLHARGPRFNHACALKLAQRIDDDLTGDAHLIRNLAGYKNPFHAAQLIKDMGDRFHL